MLSKKMDSLRFKFCVFKVKHSRMKLMEYNFKILKSCIRQLDKICIPASEAEEEVMKELLSIYDKTIEEISKSVDTYRKRIST